jgi:hypothetical protein
MEAMPTGRSLDDDAALERVCMCERKFWRVANVSLLHVMPWSSSRGVRLPGVRDSDETEQRPGRSLGWRREPRLKRGRSWGSALMS